MTNAFNWQGSPSIFTTGRGYASYGEPTVQKHRNLSMKDKPMPVTLAKSSPHLAPKKVVGRDHKPVA